MVLPGIRGDQRTPGGMPDSGYANPGGPVPSVPQGTKQQGMGANIPGVPDPKHIEELFNQYTAGQVTREDLINSLHSFSEGQGGILGLLEGMQQQGMGQPNGGTQPNQSKKTIPGIGGPGGASLTSQQPAVNIPLVKEPLDARHQQISTMLQGYGLGPADADQMSTILNPHEAGHRREWSDDEGLWTEVYDDQAKQQAALDSPSAGIAWDPTVRQAKGVPGPTYDIDPATGKSYTAHQGSSAAEMSARAGLGLDTGSIGGGYVQKYVPPTTAGGEGTYTTEKLGDIWGSGAQHLSRDMALESGGFVGSQRAWTPADIAAADKKAAEVIPTQSGYSELGSLQEPDIQTQEPTYNVGDVNPENPDQIWNGTTWVTKPAEPGVEIFTGKSHSALKGMPEGYGGYTEGSTGWKGKWKSFLNALATGGQNAPQPGTLHGEGFYVDPEGFGWPSQGVYNQFHNDMKSAPNFKNSTLQAGLPVVWTAEGTKNPEFMGWGDDGKPVFGLPGVGTQFFGLDVDGQVFYFTNDADRQAFNADGTLPDGGKMERGTGVITGSRTAPPIVPPGSTVVTPDGSNPPLPEGYKWSMDDMGNHIVVKIDDGTTVTTTDDKGNIVIPPAGSGSDTQTAGAMDGGTGEVGIGSPFTDPASIAQGAGYGYQMFDDLVKQISVDTTAADGTFSAALIAAVKDLEIMSAKGDQAQTQRMSDEIVNQLDRTAVSLRAELDRKLQAGVAIGNIEGDVTLAAKIEKNKAALEASKIAGTIPTLDNEGNLTTGSEEGLEGRVVTMTEAEKENQRKQNLAQLFGQWMPGDIEANMATLERDKFGLTKNIAAAEISGQIPAGMPGAGGNTLSAKRLAWEEDVARMNAWAADQTARNGARRNEIELQISNNKIKSDEFIASGQLAEAVEARKDATFLAKQKLDIEREKMKLDTLQALSNPATYLFAVRYGLLEQIGGVLGIQWGDDAITNDQLPRMVEPGTFPSLTDFQNATPTEREIMLAEVASSGGFTTDEAVRMIIEGAPGGQDIRRTSLVGVSR